MTPKIRPERSEAERLRTFARRSLNRRGPLTENQEQALRAALSDMHVERAGTELIAEGRQLRDPFLLADGWAVRQRLLSDGRRQIFSFVLPGDVFGFSARPDALAFYSSFALTHVTVAPMPCLPPTLQQACALAEFAWDMLSLEESAMASQVVRLGRQSAYERLIHLLLEFYYRLEAVGLTQDTSFAMPFTQEVLSDALGLSVVHTNRTLQQLRREHLIETSGMTVRLRDLQLLAEISDFRMMQSLTLQQD